MFMLIILVNSSLSHVMTSCTFLDSPEVRIFSFSDSLLLEFLDKRRGFFLDGQIDHRLVEPLPINFGTPYSLQYHKLQAVIHKKFCALNFLITAYVLKFTLPSMSK